MANSATVLADLILIVTKSTIQSCKFPELITFMIILPFRSRSSLKNKIRYESLYTSHCILEREYQTYSLNNPVYHLNTSCDLFF